LAFRHWNIGADARRTRQRKRAPRIGSYCDIRITRVRTLLAALTMSALLCGCGVFCGGVGGNGGFAGGCGTSVHF